MRAAHNSAQSSSSKDKIFSQDGRVRKIKKTQHESKRANSKLPGKFLIDQQSFSLLLPADSSAHRSVFSAEFKMSLEGSILQHDKCFQTLYAKDQIFPFVSIETGCKIEGRFGPKEALSPPFRAAVCDI